MKDEKITEGLENVQLTRYNHKTRIEVNLVTTDKYCHLSILNILFCVNLLIEYRYNSNE